MILIHTLSTSRKDPTCKQRILLLYLQSQEGSLSVVSTVGTIIPIATWTIIELHVAIIVSSIPPCRALMLRIWASFQGHSEKLKRESSRSRSYRDGKTLFTRHPGQQHNALTLEWESLGDTMNDASDSMELPLRDLSRVATEELEEGIGKTSEFTAMASKG